MFISYTSWKSINFQHVSIYRINGRGFKKTINLKLGTMGESSCIVHVLPTNPNTTHVLKGFSI